MSLFDRTAGFVMSVECLEDPYHLCNGSLFLAAWMRFTLWALQLVLAMPIECEFQVHGHSE